MKTLSHMILIGDADPVRRARVELAQAREEMTFPPSFVELLETWGAGLMLGRFRLLDPTDDHDLRGWEHWQAIMARQRPASGIVDLWITDDWGFSNLRMFAVTPEGGGLAWRITEPGPDGEFPIFYLDSPEASARVHWLADSLPEAIGRLLRGRFLGDVAAIAAPSPGGDWGFPPSYVTAATPLTDYVDAILDAILDDDDEDARVLLDAALAIYAGYDVAAVMLGAFGPQMPGLDTGVELTSFNSPRVLRAPDLGLAPAEHLKWLTFALERYRAHHPAFDDDPLRRTLLELETRPAPRVRFQVTDQLLLSVRTRDVRHADLLLIDLENRSQAPLIGFVQLLEYDDIGDPCNSREVPVSIEPGDRQTYALEDIPPSARLDFEFFED